MKQTWTALVLTVEEEKVTMDHIQVICSWGFPLNGSDLRHPELMKRFPGNIKHSHAKINIETVNEYLDNLESVLEGISPDCIFNYDETNLSDDPGQKKCLMKQGTKYPERILNNSKSCTSLMFCGSATGQILPSYVVYKALNVYQCWIERGTPNARYSCSKYGSFDNDTFEDWFIKVFFQLPKPKRSQL